jgi:hypothetical protein
MLKIVVTSVMVDDQQKALKFNTKVLGLIKKPTLRWANLAG